MKKTITDEELVSHIVTFIENSKGQVVSRGQVCELKISFEGSAFPARTLKNKLIKYLTQRREFIMKGTDRVTIDLKYLASIRSANMQTDSIQPQINSLSSPSDDEIVRHIISFIQMKISESPKEIITIKTLCKSFIKTNGKLCALRVFKNRTEMRALVKRRTEFILVQESGNTRGNDSVYLRSNGSQQQQVAEFVTPSFEELLYEAATTDDGEDEFIPRSLSRTQSKSPRKPLKPENDENSFLPSMVPLKNAINQIQELQSMPIKPVVLNTPSDDSKLISHPNYHLFAPNAPSDHFANNVLLTEEEAKLSLKYGLLGVCQGVPLYLNTLIPFCILAVGVQGVGKSYSVATIIENCMINYPPFVKSEPSLSTLVFHFDQDMSNFCEAITLTSRVNKLPNTISVVQQITVLVSPSYFLQRTRFYKDVPNCTILPLLFKWSDLNAAQIKSLMRVSSDDKMPLYMSAILDMLRKFQKSDKLPNFKTFKKALEELDLSEAQKAPLSLRLLLLESLILESPENASLPRTDLQNIFNKPNNMVIVDLTDPMMSGTEANGIFQVVLSKFLTTPLSSKLIVFDEAHKYLESSGTDELSASIVSALRQMRHHGLRLVISTQSPKSIPAEIIDLVSVALLHRFHAPDWFSYLKTKLPLKQEDFDRIINLPTGRALAFFENWPDIYNLPFDEDRFHEVNIRSRITEDAGISKIAT